MMPTQAPTIEAIDDPADAEQPDELVPNYDDLEQWPPSAGHQPVAGEETQ